MTKTIIYIGGWEGFSYYNDKLYQNIFNDTSKYEVNNLENNIDDKYLQEADIIICGSFINRSIEMYAYKTVLMITEPIQYMYPTAYSLLQSNKLKCIVCCINNDINKIKYPLYTLYNMGGDISSNIKNINKYIDDITFELFNNKQFCCLINRHDNGNTRTRIYNKLQTIDNISCPSILFNNYSNTEFEKEGRYSYQQKFIFGICPENYVTDLDGYITEKIYLTCVSGSIPIYYGKLDDIDKSIFNMNRVLLFDPNDEESLNSVYNKVNELMNNKEKLFDFYKQKPFTELCLNNLQTMENNYINRVKEILIV